MPNPNLKAAYAGASTRENRHLQPNAADAEGAQTVLPFPDSFPLGIDYVHTLTLQVGGKARETLWMPTKTDQSIVLDGDPKACVWA